MPPCGTRSRPASPPTRTARVESLLRQMVLLFTFSSHDGRSQLMSSLTNPGRFSPPLKSRWAGNTPSNAPHRAARSVV